MRPLVEGLLNQPKRHVADLAVLFVGESLDLSSERRVDVDADAVPFAPFVLHRLEFGAIWRLCQPMGPAPASSTLRTRGFQKPLNRSDQAVGIQEGTAPRPGLVGSIWNRSARTTWKTQGIYQFCSSKRPPKEQGLGRAVFETPAKKKVRTRPLPMSVIRKEEGGPTGQD